MRTISRLLADMASARESNSVDNFELTWLEVAHLHEYVRELEYTFDVRTVRQAADQTTRYAARSLVEPIEEVES